MGAGAYGVFHVGCQGDASWMELGECIIAQRVNLKTWLSRRSLEYRVSRLMAVQSGSPIGIVDTKASVYLRHQTQTMEARVAKQLNATMQRRSEICGGLTRFWCASDVAAEKRKTILRRQQSHAKRCYKKHALEDQ